jgi:hypothetical protein
MAHHLYQRLDKRFAPHADIHWAHLSRLTNLLIILNISLFFLTDLVTRHGYYYTFYSLLFLSVAAMGPLMPIGLFNRLWYYLIFLLNEAMGIYFLVVSGWYWVSTNSG